MSREPALLTSGAMDGEAQSASSERQPGGRKRTSGDGAWAAPNRRQSSAARVSFSWRDEKRRLFVMDTALFNRSETIRARLLQLRDSL